MCEDKKKIVLWIVALIILLGGGIVLAVNSYSRGVTPTQSTVQKSGTAVTMSQDGKISDSGTGTTLATANIVMPGENDLKASPTEVFKNAVSPPVSPAPQKSTNLTIIPVLYYHSIMNEAGNELRMPPEQFAAQMKYLSESGYHVLTLDQLYEVLYKNGIAPEKPVVITFDDGYSDNYTQAFPIMQKYQFSGTVFMVSSFVNGQGFLTGEQLQQLQAAGWVIGGHTKNHTNLTTVSSDSVHEELKTSREFLEGLLGQPLKYFAYPFNGYNATIEKAVRNDGYVMAFTTERGWANQKTDPFLLRRVYCYANMGMKEFARRLSNPNY